MTLLLAGHETTATGLAWTFDLLLHAPEVLERARDPRGDDAYLDAVVKESLRMRPVIAGVGRVVRGEPFRLNGYTIPPGVEINPSIRMIHRRADLYPQPREFRPERFLGTDAPDTYTWVPFGGGTRRCLGASFALMEMRIVVARVLARAVASPGRPQPEQVQFRGITMAPREGVRVVMDARRQGCSPLHTLGLFPARSPDGSSGVHRDKEIRRSFRPSASAWSEAPPVTTTFKTETTALPASLTGVAMQPHVRRRAKVKS